jgi:hypothetical protein
MPYTFAVARHTAENIRAARDYLEVPICVENVSSYAEFHASELTEWEFLSEVTELADCGILLDVNNIYVSSKNHNFDPYEYLNNIPHHRVGQIHIAGHSKFEKYILDTHDHPVLDPVWKMYAHALKLVQSNSYTLRDLGNRLEQFLREEPHWAAGIVNRPDIVVAKGTWFRTSLSSGKARSSISVSIPAGATAFTRMPRVANSRAMDLVKPLQSSKASASGDHFVFTGILPVIGLLFHNR